MPAHTKEDRFESDIVAWLVGHGGYSEGARDNFDLDLALDTVELFTFIGQTQIKEWELLIKRHGGEQETAQKKFKSRLATEIDRRGTIDVLRKGIEDQGVRFKLAYFRPASGKNPLLVERYGQNRLTVTRQLRYASKHANELDVALFVNGLPVATAELKNPLTHQTVDHAIAQYQADRDPSDKVFADRAVVHFAVDPLLVYMTTRLASKETTFRPFNLGCDGGKGNPPNPDGYATSYLWERIWSYDAWLDILGRFVHLGGDADPVKARHKGASPIFPRFHQWDAVVRLADHARTAGPGNSYLAQHSAGSGKSNTIGWLAHRLTLLHDDADVKVFDKVIIVTDRRVLDEQLRGTVQQFETVKGTIVTVEGKGGAKSSELADALASSAQIVVTTLQTFPFVLAQISELALAEKRYAIVIDEAHSSQTGDAAAALKQALGAGSGSEGAVGDGDSGDGEDALAAAVAARGRQPNLSYFAFTATPKDRTVELFGTSAPAGHKQPFHVYSMRQAIEEGYILDVLGNYTTYDTYWRVATEAGREDEEVDTRRAAAAIKRFVVRHPQVIAQKAAIIVEHYRTHTARELGGLAKAMVVTDSRQAAVRYKRAIDKHIADHHYTDVKALVAFSGQVLDDLGESVTESTMNTFPESQTAARFKGDDPYSPGDYQVLIVAEKFQTGFDEPRLHTMFVDKKLEGLAAVQTLSRLNRICPGKDRTFVLDFRNDPHEIRKAFQRWYEVTYTIPTDPNVLYDLRRRLLVFDVIDPEDARTCALTYFAADPADRSLGLIYASLDPAVERYTNLDEDGQAEFRSLLDDYVRVYAFLSQVMPFTDTELETLHVYARALAACLPKQADGGLDIGRDVVLTHLHITEIGAAEITLEAGDSEPGTAFSGGGQGKKHDPTLDTLKSVIDTLNERFGVNLTERHQLLLDQFEMTWLADETLRQFANANPIENFALEFEAIFKKTIISQEEENQAFYDLIYGNAELATFLKELYMRRLYASLRGDPHGAEGPASGTPEESSEKQDGA